MSIIVGLTGPTGAGKSAVRPVAQALGFKFVDCDILARKAVEPKSLGLKAVVAAFGEEVLSSDGSLNRKALAKAAFKNKEQTELLNKTLLPHIKALALDEVKDEMVLFDAPTLFESGLDEICNKTVAVLAQWDIRLERITKRDNITTEEALLRMNAGATDEFYKQKADYIVFNNQDFEEFNKQITHILKEITGGK